MTWIETSGKTLEEAKETAARELGVSVDEIEFEVLDDESKGFLGLGHPKVRIRASVTGGVAEQIEAVDPSGTDVKDGPLGEKTVSLVQRILEAMKFNAQAKLISESDEEINIDITGESEDIGRLIGRHGQTLDALQYLVGIAVNRETAERVRVLLDAEGYRDRHQQILEAKVRDLAKKVKETGQEAVLEPQNARDRRIVHMALADDPEIITYSEGEGDDRHVVISPRK